MKQYTQFEIKLNKNNFYIKRNGNRYPYLKDEICSSINIYDSNTFLPFLKDMDYPYFEDVWNRIIKALNLRGIDKPNSKSILGKYIAMMQLKSFKNYIWEDTEKYGYLFQSKGES